MNLHLHLLLLRYVFSVLSLKMDCIDQFERNFLAPDNMGVFSEDGLH